MGDTGDGSMCSPCVRNAQSARPALYAMIGLDLPEEEMNALAQDVLELNIFDPASLRAFEKHFYRQRNRQARPCLKNTVCKQEAAL